MNGTRDSASPGSKEGGTLNWRFEFGSYLETRSFLDQMAGLSERMGFYPDISFGKTYVNVSIDAVGQGVLAENISAFIGEMKAYAAVSSSGISRQNER
jgi:pterin-4a-carbinolamine dehydratase